MIFLISLCLALMFAWHGSKLIKKNATLLYLLASALSFALIAMTHSGATTHLPNFVRVWIWPMLANCTLATAFFVIVMMMAVLKKGGKAVKTLMPIRAELSIIACILTIGHNIAYGKTYFVMLFTRPERLEGNLLWAAICSVVMILIMLPLMVTSFRVVRRKMKAQTWKKLQRCAYAFYALIYVHVILLSTMFLASGRNEYLWNILAYSAVFLTYGILRIRKALSKNHSVVAKRITPVLICAAMIFVACLCAPGLSSLVKSEADDPTQDELQASETTSEDIPPSTESVTTPEEPSQTQAPSETNETNESLPTVTYIDGVYFGSGEGYIGKTQVAVTIKNGAISSVVVVSSKDDASYVTEAKSLIPNVISTQRTDLDAVTGATYSSQAILDAIEDALSTAVGGS